jgi:hypothetical protein
MKTSEPTQMPEIERPIDLIDEPANQQKKSPSPAPDHHPDDNEAPEPGTAAGH